MGDLAELVPGGIGKAVANQDCRKYGLLIEFCCSENSSLCKVAHHLGISYLGITKESFDISDDDSFQQLVHWLQDEIQESNGPVHLWGSLPCTKWSPWQNMAIHKHGEHYREQLERDRDVSRSMIMKFTEIGQLVKCSRGGSVTIEWSKDSSGWTEPVVVQMIEFLELLPVEVHGCAFGLEIQGKFPNDPIG